MKMETLLEILADDSEESTWRKIGEEALKAAIHTLVEEGIEAAVEIWKKRQLKIQEEYLERRDWGDDEEAGTPETGVSGRARRDYPGTEDEEPSVQETDESPASGSEVGSRTFDDKIEGFGEYVGKQNVES